ncbi:MAG TPA: DUF2167 domain-containing protein [Steroidobacteraceae bacterium]|nr:DUF2167 domain-containing protein [Steroidobacteraceae bacterium]
MRFVNITSAWLLCAALAMPAFAQDSPEPGQEAASAESAEGESEALPELKFKTGDIVLPNKVATLHLGEKYHYLAPEEASQLLQMWGNPPDDSTQGAIYPAGVNPLSETGWAVFLTYLDEGHIDDSDAAEIDYDDMLKDLKEGTEDNNSARKDAGFEAVHLVGWAESPRYDAATKKLYWAKELDFEGSPSHTVNYDVRVLGREGVLSMNAVASMDQLQQIRTEMRPLLDVAEFNEGYRYAEFNASTDRMAEYGLGALIAAGVGAKLGLFAKLGALLLAFKKFIIIGLIALGGFLAKMFGKKKDEAA